MFKKLRVFLASLMALILAISLSTLSSPAAPKGEPITWDTVTGQDGGPGR